MKYFAGIGSRETPQDVLYQMRGIASVFTANGYILRSGGAKGADSAFESGVVGSNKEIFYARDATAEAIELASNYHPAWDRLKSDYVRGLMGRNMQIISGKDLDNHVEFVVCWTKDGKATGGTGQALRYVANRGIPVYNLFNNDDLVALRERARLLI